jgi:hypothetical protein
MWNSGTLETERNQNVFQIQTKETAENAELRGENLSELVRSRVPEFHIKENFEKWL